ncbi:MAG: hypothetical protein HQ558_00850 [Candidatus Omnitrophica bacterium]|nr:hypothetical protein [Candidatus Omnitrophota bacterium]
MMVGDFSPEERLLRLIKGKRQPDPAPKEAPAHEPVVKVSIEPEIKPVLQEAKTEPAQGTTAQPEKRSAKGDKGAASRRPAFSFNMTSLYIIVGVVFLMFLGFLVFGIFASNDRQDFENLEKMVTAISQKVAAESPQAGLASGKEESPPAATGPKQSFNEYQKLLNEKNIFVAPVKRKKQAPAPEGPSLRELAKDMKLVGVMPGDDPQAIIEDKKNGQTIFLRKGDDLEGIKIKDILNDRVVLSRGEETATLSL